MYTPEFTMYNFMKEYGTPTTKETAPNELSLVIGMILHMYMRLWTPNTTTSIDVRSVPYALRKSNHIGTDAAMSVYKTCILPSHQMVRIPYKTFDAMCTFYNLYQVARESPLFDAALQAVTVAWCEFADGERIIINKLLPILSSGDYIDIAGIASDDIDSVRWECAATDNKTPLYVNYLNVLYYGRNSPLKLSVHYLEKITHHIHQQRIGNLNPYCVVGMAKHIHGAIDRTGLLSSLDNELRRSWINMDDLNELFSTWAALYFLPIIEDAKLAKRDLWWARHYALKRSRYRVAPGQMISGLEASAFDALDKLDEPGSDTQPKNIDPEKTTPENYEKSATTTTDKADNDLGTDDDTQETTSDIPTNNNNNVGERTDGGDTVQDALKMHFLRVGIIRLFKMAKEKGVAGDLLSVVPMLYLLEKTDLTKLRSKLVTAINKAQHNL